MKYIVKPVTVDVGDELKWGIFENTNPNGTPVGRFPSEAQAKHVKESLEKGEQ